jgi:hypothetical protein
MIHGTMHWRDEKVARKERPSHTVRYLKELEEQERQKYQQESPEELEEERRAYQKHVLSQKKWGVNIPPFPDSRSRR